MLILKKRYSREEVSKNSKIQYVFGDNMVKKGFGGQAKACRGLANTIGIPTKNFPTMERNAFFHDADYSRVSPIINSKFDYIETLLDEGVVVVWPEDGIGTGLARLKETAPKIFQLIQDRFNILLEQEKARKCI